MGTIRLVFGPHPRPTRSIDLLVGDTDQTQIDGIESYSNSITSSRAGTIHVAHDLLSNQELWK